MKHAHACRRPLWRVKPQGGAVQLVPRSAVIHDEVVGCALEAGVQHADLIERGGEAAKLNDYKMLCSQHMSPSMHPYYMHGTYPDHVGVSGAGDECDPELVKFLLGLLHEQDHVLRTVNVHPKLVLPREKQNK